MQSLFNWAKEQQCALVAFNISNMEVMKGITAALNNLSCPAILQVSAGARRYTGADYLRSLFDTAQANTKQTLVLHLDHGDSFELCKDCIDHGFDSVMIDGSHLPYEENIALTKKVVDYAHAHDVWVEGELGEICGIEDVVNVATSKYTDPAKAREFVARTGVDSLAVSIGTAHGAYKYAAGSTPALRFDILKQIHAAIPDTPLVLHGASSVIPEYVATINQFGGEIKDAVGIHEQELAKAINDGVRKINIDSDLRLAITATIRQYFQEHPAVFDPRSYWTEAMKAVTAVAERKLKYYTLRNVKSLGQDRH